MGGWNHSARGKLYKKNCVSEGDWLSLSFFEHFKFLLVIRLEGDILKLGILVYSSLNIVHDVVLEGILNYLVNSLFCLGD